MKRLLLLLITLFLFSCTTYYKQAATVSEQVYVGMSIKDFKLFAGKKATLESMDNGWTIYRMNDYDAWTGAITSTKFFYFTDGKLSKMDGGVLRETRQSINLNVKQEK